MMDLLISEIIIRINLQVLLLFMRLKLMVIRVLRLLKRLYSENGHGELLSELLKI